MTVVAECVQHDLEALDLTDSEREEKSNALKNEGNNFFKEGHFDEAVKSYSAAILVRPTAVLFANRSQAFLKKELFGLALEDAGKSIELDKSYVKAYFRRASANMALGKFQKALRDYEAVCSACPNDGDARKRRDECKKHVKRIAFEKAISMDHNKRPLTEMINLDSLEVEASYDGPRLDGPITAEFMKEMVAVFKKQGKLHIKYAFKILLQVYEFLKAQPNMVEIEVPDDHEFTVCGDVHGQFYDLCNIFELRGFPSEKNPYLFNGDFVDRGSFSVETIFTMFGFKLLYPNHFFLSRGNHESDVMNKMYGFEGEVKAKYNQLMCDFFTEIFCHLPLCHLLNRQLFVCHGGLFAEDGVTFDDIQKVDRVRQPPDSGIMCDLLWADPMDLMGRAPSKRGVSYQFGPDITERWCDANDVKYVIRSHEVKPEGWEEQSGGRCFTLFSAPNYCDSVGNMGAYAIVTGKNMKPKFVSFKAVPHPAVPAMKYASSLFGL